MQWYRNEPIFCYDAHTNWARLMDAVAVYIYSQAQKETRIHINDTQ